MQPIVVNIQNAQVNTDLIRRGLSGVLADLDSAAVLTEGEGVDATELRQAHEAFRQIASMVEEAASGVENGCGTIMASKRYSEYHKDFYGCEPTGVFQ